jgi:Cellulase (glycosyl hydrolase family 5)
MDRHRPRRPWCWVFLTLLFFFSSLAATNARQSTQVSNNVYLPIVVAPPVPPSLFGVDVRSYANDGMLPYVQEANPRWVRAGDALWAYVERERGVYDWSMLAQLEANVVRLRKLGLEPIVVVQQSPSWAQREPGRLCSPPNAEHLDDFARFMGAIAARYASGPAMINYWEVWNEPDYTIDEVQSDLSGFGCWASSQLPYTGGQYYGDALNRVYPVIKANNPNAVVLAGALSYELSRENVSRDFTRGMLVSTAGNSFDALSFHAYGEWGAGDLLLLKTDRLRAILAEYGLSRKPLFATEIAATCYSVRNLNVPAAISCPADFEQRQANYAARIYAETIALDLMGGLWYTLVASGTDVAANAQLIDDVNGTMVPRAAFYAFRNSGRLLNGARYTGPPLREPTDDQLEEVQALTFRKGNNTLYVLWVPVADFPKFYNLQVPAGVTAVCTDQLNRATPATYYCSDLNGDGIIPRAINELPQYVELIGR